MQITLFCNFQYGKLGNTVNCNWPKYVSDWNNSHCILKFLEIGAVAAFRVRATILLTLIPVCRLMR